MRLEYRSVGSNKFWEPKVCGNSVVVRFGKIGTNGQTRTSRFASSEKARGRYDQLVREKLSEGYKLTHEAVFELFQTVLPVENPIAIGSLYAGEHVPDEVIQDLCGWMTACIQHGMTPKQFKGVWDRLLGGEDEDLEKALGQVGEDSWIDMLECDEDELHEFYSNAVEKGVDKFIWFDNNAYISVVALCGDPGARAIEVCVLQEENCKDGDGWWINNWPTELNVGAPIASMSCSDVTLRDGQRYTSAR